MSVCMCVCVCVRVRVCVCVSVSKSLSHLHSCVPTHTLTRHCVWPTHRSMEQGASTRILSKAFCSNLFHRAPSWPVTVMHAMRMGSGMCSFSTLPNLDLLGADLTQCVRACVCACVCVRACVRACACVCACVRELKTRAFAIGQHARGCVRQLHTGHLQSKGRDRQAAPRVSMTCRQGQHTCPTRCHPLMPL